MTLLALPWFVLATTCSPGRVGVVMAADLVPMVLRAIPGGVLAGRLGAPHTTLACDLARAPLIGLVPLLNHLRRLPFPVLVELVVLHGLFYPPYWTSQGRYCPGWSATTSNGSPCKHAAPSHQAPDPAGRAPPASHD
jgi:hypothetical protein